MKGLSELDQRPVIVAIAGPNGAGKSTFYHAHIKHAGLRYIEADVFAREFDIEAYAAAKMADVLRRSLVKHEESFAFETVFSDPAGDKLKFLKEAADSGHTVLLCFIGLAGPELSEERVAMRVSQGGHDVPTEKLKSSYPRAMANLKAAILRLPLVCVFDNSGLGRPFCKVAVFRQGKALYRSQSLPAWFEILKV